MDAKAEEYVHICKLPREVEVISYFIPDSQKFRQWFRTSCLISSDVSHRRLCVKSFRALEQDRAIHLTQHYYIIHPFSAFRFYWEILMIGIYLIQLITIPFIIILEQQYFESAIWFALILQLVTLTNMVIQFMSGYLEQSPRNIILEPSVIVKNYLKTFFITDFLGNIPMEICFFLMKSETIIPRGIMLKVIFNAFGLFDYTKRFREKRQLPLCTFRLIQCIFIYIIGTLWITSLTGVAVYIDQKIIFTWDIWWLLINKVFVSIFCSGQTEFILYGCELYVHCLAFTFGFIMRAIITVQIVLLFLSFYSSKRKYTQLLSELQEFSRLKLLPRKIKVRLFDYYKFVFQQHYYNENEIWNLMSDKLKYEIEENLYKNWFEADIFKLCPPQVVQSLVLLLKKEIYLSSDVIYSHGTFSDYIYFLNCGTVAVYDEHGNELFHVQEGSFFSDLALVLDTRKTNESTAIAVEACEVYKLHREDFRQVIQQFPQEYKVILNILQKRNKYISVNPKSILDLQNYYELKQFDEDDDDDKKEQ